MVDRVAGSLLGGAIGDALGAPIEFTSLREIRERFGPAGITDFAPAYGRRGAITDDTQMALFTADGLLRAEASRRAGLPGDDVTAVHQAYLRWLLTQRDASQHRTFPAATRRENLGWLYRQKEIRSVRAPGTTCIASLRGETIGSPERPVNASKGCGGLMRIAPVGLFVADPRDAFELGCRIAAITHGHPSGFLAAGVLASLIASLASGLALEPSLDGALALLRERPSHGECAGALQKAFRAFAEREPVPETVESLGAGWVAEEALAIGVYAALAARGEFERGVLLAVNHGGDSDSTGAVAGNILGTIVGKEGIPARYLESLELGGAIEEVARDLTLRYRDGAAWAARYPTG